MEHPTNLMVISGFFAFDESLDHDEIVRTLETRLLRFERFRQRVVEGVLTQPPHWQLHDDFRIERHVDVVHLDGPDDDEFHDLVDRLVATPLERDQPLWHATLINRPGVGSAVLFRIHHAVGDGMALLRVLLSVCDPERVPDAPKPGAGESPDAVRMSVLGRAVGMTTRLIGEGLHLARHPSRTWELASGGTALGRALARLTLLSSDPPTPLKGALGTTKRAAWTDAIPLTEVKAIARAADATVNDVLVSHVSGAIGRYLAEHGHPTTGLVIRAMVPVNVRPINDEPSLGNRFGLVLPALPMDVDDHRERIAEVKTQMDTIKRTPEAVVSYAILRTIGTTANQVQQFVVNFFGTKTSMVLTNVPGPRSPLWFAGNRVRRMMFWVPQSGRLGLGVSILSYNGEVAIGVISDAGLIPNPQEIVGHLHTIHTEMIEVAQSARRSPPARCIATTVRGDRCKNQSKAGVSRCWVHARANR